MILLILLIIFTILILYSSVVIAKWSDEHDERRVIKRNRDSKRREK